jgi:hypothetical protein
MIALNRALKTYLAVLTGLWAIALLILELSRHVLHQGYPFNTIFVRGIRFWDFTVYAPRFAVWGNGDLFFSLPGFPFDYPPPLLVSELAYYKISSNPLYAYFATVILFVVAGALLVAMAVPKRRRIRPLAIAAAVATAVFSYPLFFLLDRGNIEGLVWIASSLGLLFFVRSRYLAAALFLALATAMKIFPGVLLLLFVTKRRYREFCVSLAAVAVITYASLWLAGPTTLRAAQGIWEGMDHLRQDQVLEIKPQDVGFDHSAWSFAKQIFYRFDHSVEHVNALLPKVYQIYALLAVAAFAALYCLHIRYLPVVNQILALSDLSVMLPFVSYNYTLVHMLAPFSFLVLILAVDTPTGRLRLSYRQMLFLLLPFAFIFTPQNYLALSILDFDGQVKFLALLALLVATLRIPVPSSLFNELPERKTILVRVGQRSLEAQECA